MRLCDLETLDSASFALSHGRPADIHGGTFYLLATFAKSILLTTLLGQWIWPCFKDKETEAESSPVSYPTPHGRPTEEVDSNLDLDDSQDCLSLCITLPPKKPSIHLLNQQLSNGHVPVLGTVSGLGDTLGVLMALTVYQEHRKGVPNSS